MGKIVAVLVLTLSLLFGCNDQKVDQSNPEKMGQLILDGIMKNDGDYISRILVFDDKLTFGRTGLDEKQLEKVEADFTSMTKFIADIKKGENKEEIRKGVEKTMLVLKKAIMEHKDELQKATVKNGKYNKTNTQYTIVTEITWKNGRVSNGKGVFLKEDDKWGIRYSDFTLIN